MLTPLSFHLLLLLISSDDCQATREYFVHPDSADSCNTGRQYSCQSIPAIFLKAPKDTYITLNIHFMVDGFDIFTESLLIDNFRMILQPDEEVLDASDLQQTFTTEHDVVLRSPYDYEPGFLHLKQFFITYTNLDASIKVETNGQLSLDRCTFTSPSITTPISNQEEPEIPDCAPNNPEAFFIDCHGSLVVDEHTIFQGLRKDAVLHIQNSSVILRYFRFKDNFVNVLVDLNGSLEVQSTNEGFDAYNESKGVVFNSVKETKIYIVTKTEATDNTGSVTGAAAADASLIFEVLKHDPQLHPSSFTITINEADGNTDGKEQRLVFGLAGRDLYTCKRGETIYTPLFEVFPTEYPNDHHFLINVTESDGRYVEGWLSREYFPLPADQNYTLLFSMTKGDPLAGFVFRTLSAKSVTVRLFSIVLWLICFL
ncbi:hypothetical protein BLNAU_6473 [Blattamonas nauphoetae]|uniref:Uncharacterized protein n=1 Tax=Blattamonas nauphoetae TaxID=2049346 RepID=A0ABQ9Y407_9EUKA|nr:hypothetical protein BLNAU_6473 [Blattamonas nauphoetae]